MFLPPNCSHVLQPLDIGVFGPLKNKHFKRARDFIVRARKARAVKQVTTRNSSLREASEAATAAAKVRIHDVLAAYVVGFAEVPEETVRSSWVKSGIFPLDIAKIKANVWVEKADLVEAINGRKLPTETLDAAIELLADLDVIPAGYAVRDATDDSELSAPAAAASVRQGSLMAAMTTSLAFSWYSDGLARVMDSPAFDEVVRQMEGAGTDAAQTAVEEAADSRRSSTSSRADASVPSSGLLVGDDDDMAEQAAGMHDQDRVQVQNVFTAHQVMEQHRRRQESKLAAAEATAGRARAKRRRSIGGDADAPLPDPGTRQRIAKLLAERRGLLAPPELTVDERQDLEHLKLVVSTEPGSQHLASERIQRLNELTAKQAAWQGYMEAHSLALRALSAGKELAACLQSPFGVIGLQAEGADLPLSIALNTMYIVTAHHAAAEDSSVSEAAPPSSSSSSSAANHAQLHQGCPAHAAAARQSSAIAASPPDPPAPVASQPCSSATAGAPVVPAAERREIRLCPVAMIERRRRVSARLAAASSAASAPSMSRDALRVWTLPDYAPLRRSPRTAAMLARSCRSATRAVAGSSWALARAASSVAVADLEGELGIFANGRTAAGFGAGWGAAAGSSTWGLQVVKEPLAKSFFLREVIPRPWAEGGLFSQAQRPGLGSKPADKEVRAAAFLTQFVVRTSNYEGTVDAAKTKMAMRARLDEQFEELVTQKRDFESLKAWLDAKVNSGWKLDSHGTSECPFQQLLATGVAMLFLWASALQDKPLTTCLVLQAHALLTYRSDTPTGIRSHSVVFGALEGCDAAAIPRALDDLLTRFEENRSKFHPVSNAAALLHRFLCVHPFTDGNGRTARMLAAFALIRDGVAVPLVLSSGRRVAKKDFMLALQLADGGHLASLAALVCKSLVDLDKVLNGAMPSCGDCDV
ncbi:hypothetical protein FNF27_04919 [Cafeteria roenbergensis]|uniref:Fido domain-containing protein n=1 Tax=Cafeteria roenbergensis TaxID=33653 RepID=A0A5A8E719_CAFRO|nr:hypothetical protein FNF27_04919 [Cafeteria roenbergensis]